MGNEDIYRYRVHMHVRGQWGSKKNETRCGDKFPRNKPRNVDRDFRGFYIREAFCKINIVGQSSPLGLDQATRVFSGLFSRMLLFFARCIIVKMSNHFLRTQGGRRPRSLLSNAIPGLVRFRFKRIIRDCFLVHGQITENYPSKIAAQLHYSRLTNEFNNAALLRVCSYTKKKKSYFPSCQRKVPFCSLILLLISFYMLVFLLNLKKLY